ncbi:hypothetical protein FRC10_005799 [Ceratobasidium sp. 414]|nr:hypothetical protein FRC10_005799 [Ceratobasidium sp. 414]
MGVVVVKVIPLRVSEEAVEANVNNDLCASEVGDVENEIVVTGAMDSFSPSQLYALLILPDGGPDLEHYLFARHTPWRTASSIFWQTAQTLAITESFVRFEHRDLHSGQILIQNIPGS